MKRFFSVLLAGMLAVPVAGPASRADAAQVGFDLVVTAAPGGLFAGQPSSRGGVVYDEDLVPTGFGSSVALSRSGGNGTLEDATLGLFFDFGPFTFTGADALSEPVFTFVSGVLRSIRYVVTSGSTPNDLVAFGVGQFTFLINPAIRFSGHVYFVQARVDPLAPVPLPAGLPLLAGGLGGMVLLRRRARRA
ncbi:MAG: VPLPA-CTERM sorting domain-containing protein [Paracoccaceae bacterium]